MGLGLYMHRMVHTLNRSIVEYMIVNGRMNNIIFKTNSVLPINGIQHFSWSKNSAVVFTVFGRSFLHILYSLYAVLKHAFTLTHPDIENN